MKKYILSALVMIMLLVVLCFVGCGEDSKEIKSDAPINTAEATPIDDNKEEPTAEPKNETLKIDKLLLPQGDEIDIYESPVELKADGSYELVKIGVKDTNESYDGTNVTGVEPTRGNFYEYVLPGANIPRDPKIFVTKKSGASAYLYLEVLEENFPTSNSGDSLIYYELEDYWTPVVDAEGKHQKGKNGGMLYVYYEKNNDYFDKYNKVYNKDAIGQQNATCLNSYVLKSESDAHIEKDIYYGINEVDTVDGNVIKCPYYNIIKNNTIYVSEKYVHSEYYSTFAPTTENQSEFNFRLFFYGYMVSAKVENEFIDPYNAYLNLES